MFQLNPAPLDSENNNLSESKLYKKSNNKTLKNKKSVEFDESNITNTKNNEVLKNKITSLGNLMSKIHENNEEDENLNTNYQSNTIDESISTSFTDSLNEQLAKIQKMREAGNNIPQNNFFNNELQNSNTNSNSNSNTNTYINMNNASNTNNSASNLENSNVLNSSNLLKNNLSNYSDSYKLNYNSLSQNIDSHNYDNNKLLSKLDYIVHLLEEQHNEKTNYITEELILYLFLGIFILFVLDSFARASKYVR
jgi:hypothetical protein